MTTYFVSDLHLESARPDISEQFLAFLGAEARTADALYILGDLFESWVGDDDDDPHNLTIQHALHQLTLSGVPGYFMHGNRDFMIGERFATNTGLNLLPDPTKIELHGTTVLLSHGDQYCTDDLEYQAFRRQTRDAAWQQQILGLPLAERRRLAGEIRQQSQTSSAGKPPEIMDVNEAAIQAALREHNATRMLHGHTHRPAVHRFALNESTAMRIVLGDWYAQASILRWDESGFVLDVAERS